MKSKKIWEEKKKEKRMGSENEWEKSIKHQKKKKKSKKTSKIKFFYYKPL
jgi:hypothetical protein